MTHESQQQPDSRTAHLELHRPTEADIPALHSILSDPRVWTHYPARRHTDPEQTARTVRDWLRAWDSSKTGYWVVRLANDPSVVGYGGCTLLDDTVWNLGYRLSPSVQGRGYATELATHAIDRAHTARPELPVIAYLLQHNLASAAVARKVGLELQHQIHDAGNPDPGAIREIYSDRPLTPPQLAATLH